MNQVKIEAKTKTEMAQDYKVNLRTYGRWVEPFLDEIGDYRGLYTPKQVGVIYEKLGLPSNV
jgi:hypothetical protein|tara:strand:+ start:1786 stop:1971 length:186 start_codon:yes stop_codon:yes gene_type:complete